MSKKLTSSEWQVASSRLRPELVEGWQVGLLLILLVLLLAACGGGEETQGQDATPAGDARA